MFMRFIALAILLATLPLATSLVGAQQSTEEAAEEAVADAVVEPAIIIDADSTWYDLRSGVTRFNDNVTIQRGAMEVHADEGVAQQTDGRYTLIELFGSPTTWHDRLDDGSIVEGRAGRIQYDVIENMVTLTGDARLSHEKGEFTGDELVYDLDTESLAGRGTNGNQARVVLEGDSVRRRSAANAGPEADSGEDNGNDNNGDDNSGEDAAVPKPVDESDDEKSVDPPEGR